MTLSVKSLLSAVACVLAVTFTFSACSLPGTSGDSSSPSSSQSQGPQSTNPVDVSQAPREPKSVHNPLATRRDKTGLFCDGQPVAEVAFEGYITKTVPLNDEHSVEVHWTPYGVNVVGNPKAIDDAVSSILVNHSVGTNVPLDFAQAGLVEDGILLRVEFYGLAETLTLCGGQLSA